MGRPEPPHRRGAAQRPLTTLSYNADGLRYQKEDDSGTRRFVWDQEAYLVEADENNSPQVVYTQEPTEFGGLISQRRLSDTIWTPSYHLLDGLGSTVRLIDSAGLITDLYAYKAFGEPLLTAGTTQNPLRWVGSLGYYYDINLLDYYLTCGPERTIPSWPGSCRRIRWGLREAISTCTCTF